jgi:hypothetical protein
MQQGIFSLFRWQLQRPADGLCRNLPSPEGMVSAWRCALPDQHRSSAFSMREAAPLRSCAELPIKSFLKRVQSRPGIAAVVIKAVFHA